MPWRAFTVVLHEMLVDAEELLLAHRHAVRHPPYTMARLMALNRAAVGAAVSAWECYIEALAREAVEALRPLVGAPPLAWPGMEAFTAAQLGGFHNPSTSNIDRLFRECFGLANLSQSWAWRGTTSPDAVRRLGDILTNRNQASHGVHPRPTVLNE